MPSFRLPPRRRVLRISAVTAALTATAIAAWFVYFDFMMVYASNLGALTALNAAAVRAAKRGDFKEADRIFYSSMAVQERKRYRDPFGFDNWRKARTHALWAEAAADQQHWDEAEAGYQIALQLARDHLVGQQVVYWELVSDHGDLLRRAGRIDQALAEFDAAEKGLKAERVDADRYEAADVDAALTVVAARRNQIRK